MKRVLSVFLALCMAVGWFAASIYLLGTGSITMRTVMKRYAPPQDTGLPAEEYAPVASMITGYLNGDEIPFQHIYTVNGTEYTAFNQKEQQHMEDVQSLFRLCRMICFVCLGGYLLTELYLLWGDKDRTNWRTFRRTLLAVLAVVTAVILLACIDFNSLFVLFHKLAFTNDLWLLNPQTDLLIRLMPIEFFILYAVLIGLLWLTGMAVLLILSTHYIRRMKGSDIK
ncbi:MAG: TIGR01906 family membrane protein [Clostridia bacterium]|nr:TIGR01906 family membrane protein [Clostridia bacterium]